MINIVSQRKNCSGEVAGFGVPTCSGCLGFDLPQVAIHPVEVCSYWGSEPSWGACFPFFSGN